MSEVSYLNICTYLEFPMELGCMENYDHFVSLEFLKIQFCKQKNQSFNSKNNSCPSSFPNILVNNNWILRCLHASHLLVIILNIC